MLAIVHLWWWIERATGASNTTGIAYGFYSGFFGDLPILAAICLFYFHHNCHTHGCFRIGHPDIKGTVICKKHIVSK